MRKFTLVHVRKAQDYTKGGIKGITAGGIEGGIRGIEGGTAGGIKEGIERRISGINGVL